MFSDVCFAVRLLDVVMRSFIILCLCRAASARPQTASSTSTRTLRTWKMRSWSRTLTSRSSKPGQAALLACALQRRCRAAAPAAQIGPRAHMYSVGSQ